MKRAESVTFGGSGLDRAAHLRGDADRQAQLLEGGHVVPVWRGKPLLCGDGAGWLPAGHPVLAGAEPPVFLGLDEGRPRFAADISRWQPGPGTEAVEQGFLDGSRQGHPDLSEAHGFVELRGVMTRLSPRDAELLATARALLQWHRTHGFCAACGVASAPVMAGWQRTCPACGTHHFPRTDPVVIMLVTHGNRVLLGRNAAWPERMYSLLAGFVEPGETIEAAVRREVQEEAGVVCGAVQYLASQPWPYPASLMLGCQAEALDDRITLDRDELQDALWVSREDMVAVLAGRHPLIGPPRKGAIAQFLLVNWLADRLE